MESAEAIRAFAFLDLANNALLGDAAHYLPSLAPGVLNPLDKVRPQVWAAQILMRQCNNLDSMKPPLAYSGSRPRRDAQGKK